MARGVALWNAMETKPARLVLGSASGLPHENRSCFAGVVGGIAHCGNCLGVPAIGGEVQGFFRGKMNGSRAGRQLSWNGG